MFMNRVHEQRPKIDSGTIPSQNGSKIGRVHRVHSPRPARAPSAQAARLPRPCCARLARPALRCRAPLPRAAAARRCPQALPPRLPLPRALPAARHACRAQPSAPRTPSPAPLRLPVRPARPCGRACCPAPAVSWLGWPLYCNTVQPCPCSTVAIQFFYCNTNSQPNPAASMAIHSSVLQHNPTLQASFSAIQKLYSNIIFFPLSLPCNTISQYKLCSSHFQISAPNFFFVFYYKYIYFFIYFQKLENSLKITKINFFSFIFLDTQINS